MPGPTTELLDSDVKELRGAIHKIALELGKLAAEFGVFKWLVGLTLVASLSGICGGIWWAATINANLKSLEVRFDKFEEKIDSRFEKIELRLDKVESRLEKLEAKIDSRFDKLEASIVKALEKARLPGPNEAR